MAMDEQRYKEVMEKIYSTARYFAQKYNQNPNVVMMDRETYDDLKDVPQLFYNLHPNYTEANPTIFGMDIKVTDTDKIMVGYMLEI